MYFLIFSIPAFCDYWRFGTGGHQENVNAICILALNIINDKVSIIFIHQILIALLQVFLILWWWMLMLLFLAAVRLLYRAVQCKWVPLARV